MRVIEQARSFLVELVDVTKRGLVDLGPVVAAAAEGDVEVAVLTDEELHWLGNADAAPKAFLDAPRLAQLGEAEQQAALDTAAWIMLARGEFDWAGETPHFNGAHALVGDLRRRARSVAVLRVDYREQGGWLSAVYEAGPDLLLVEDVSDTGLHRFVFRSPRLAAQALAGQVDPHRRAAATTPPQTARTVTELDPSPDDMVRTCEASSLLYHAALTSPDRIAARALTVYSGWQGVWALAGQRGGDGWVAWQQVDGGALLDLLDAFLRREVGG